VAQSAILLVAGIETSSVTISYTLFELAKQPSLQKKVRDEIANVIGKENLTYEHISEMKYLNQVVSETLRLYPPVPIIDRVSVEDYQVSIYFFKSLSNLTALAIPLNELR
jgi:cytochrome P450 family 6